MTSYSFFDIQQGAGTLLVGAVGPAYTPPNIRYYDATQIIVPAGRYHQAGSRWMGQYDRVNQLSFYWDLPESYLFTVSSGFLGCSVSPLWYGVFMVDDENTIEVLPYLRIYSVEYNTVYSGKTTVVPGSSEVSYWDAQVEEGGIITTSGQWNGYRLRKWSNDFNSATRDWVGDIEDTVSGTTDRLVFDGDATDYIGSAGIGLQIVPAEDRPHLYLGSIRWTSTPDVFKFDKRGWKYYFYNRWSVTANAATSAGNTFMIAAPPSATKVGFAHYSGDDNTNYSYGHYNWFYAGESGETSSTEQPAGNNTQNIWDYHDYRTQYKRCRNFLEFNLTNCQCVRNRFSRFDSGSYAPEFAYMYICNWSE